MCTNTKQVKPSNLLIVVILTFICVIGCSPILPQEAQNTDINPQTPLPSINEQVINTPALPSTPTYILTFYPKQSSSKDLYDESLTSAYPSGRGIILRLRGNRLGLKKENISLEIIAERSELLVNGNRIPDDLSLLGDGLVEGYGPYLLSWAPQLAPGLHEATFRFLNDFGETLEFTWQFILTDE